ncbi:right-handed parallel beta-helix repeat-containing protein [Pseudooceanicola sp. MF1-13]|uniref:right-handed parallel beta-helix repeat-containing protein n=1 Tax=Pseudooceanicola sp. MF1-13 TaxID=3379095 RepID=UPI003891BDCB
MGFLRCALGLGLVLWSAVPGIAQEFEARMSGIYTAGEDFDFPVQMVIWPDEQSDGFGGSVTISGARYPLYAERDGAALRGIFEAEGAVQRFAFLPPERGLAQVEFTGEAAPVAMKRTALPSFRARFEGDFGSLSLRIRDGAVQAVFTDDSGVQENWQGQRLGLRVMFSEGPASVVYEPTNSAYYLEMPGFFGAVEALPLPIIVGASPTADVPSLEAALAEVEPGGRITLEPGQYAGSWDISKPVEIVGLGGAPEKVVITSDGEAGMVWSADGGVLAGVSLRMAEAGTALDMQGGALVVRDSLIETAKGRGVVLGGSARLEIADTTLRGGQHGIVADGFTGLLRVSNSVLSDTEKSIVSVSGASQGKATVEFTQNTLSGSSSNAFRLVDGVVARLSENQISDVRVGFHQTNAGGLELNQNLFTEIGTHAIWIEGLVQDGALVVTENGIADVGEACLLFYNFQPRAASAEVTNNSFRDCGKFGLAIVGSETAMDQHRLRIEGGRFEQNGSHIFMNGAAHAVGSGLEMVDAAGPAIVLSDTSAFDLRDSRIDTTADHGMMAVGPGVDVALAAVEIVNAAKSGAVFSGGAQGGFEQVEIRQSGAHGIELHTGSKLSRFEGNVIQNNEGAGVRVDGAFFVPGENNRFIANVGGDVVRN